jgi:hypothetical protein
VIDSVYDDKSEMLRSQLETGYEAFGERDKGKKILKLEANKDYLEKARKEFEL